MAANVSDLVQHSKLLLLMPLLAELLPINTDNITDVIEAVKEIQAVLPKKDLQDLYYSDSQKGLRDFGHLFTHPKEGFCNAYTKVFFAPGTVPLCMDTQKYGVNRRNTALTLVFSLFGRTLVPGLD